jgi:trimeric autotransporter adhesin
MYRSSLSRLLSTGVRVSVAALILLLAHSPVHSAPLGTALTHKGEYKPGGTVVTGIYDFQIVLFNVATLGTPIVSPVTHENVPVTQSNFTVEINYGAPPFATATQYWLETRVRAGTSTGAFTILPVRQKLNAVPYALNVRTLPPGIVTGTSIAPNAVGPVAILDNSITATDIGINAVGLTEINPTQVQTRVSAICAPGLSMRAIGQTGTVVNFASPGVRGATIGGGGVPTGDTDPDFVNEGPNQVTDVYGTIAGGYRNLAGNNGGTVTDGPFATVGGGAINATRGASSTVAGAIPTPRAATPAR